MPLHLVPLLLVLLDDLFEDSRDPGGRVGLLDLLPGRREIVEKQVVHVLLPDLAGRILEVPLVLKGHVVVPGA